MTATRLTRNTWMNCSKSGATTSTSRPASRTKDLTASNFARQIVLKRRVLNESLLFLKTGSQRRAQVPSLRSGVVEGLQDWASQGQRLVPALWPLAVDGP